MLEGGGGGGGGGTPFDICSDMSSMITNTIFFICTLLKTNNAKKMGFVNCKNAAQFPFMQPINTSLVPNTTPFIDFGLNLLATGRVEQTIMISVVMSPVNLSFLNRVC